MIHPLAPVGTVLWLVILLAIPENGLFKIKRKKKYLDLIKYFTI